MRPIQLVAAVVALSSFSAAWPDLFGEVRAVDNVHAMLYGRQDNKDSESPQPTATATDAPQSTGDSKDSKNSKDSSKAAETTDASSAKETESDSHSATGTDKNSKTTAKSSGSHKPTATKKIPADAPVGGIQMITPGPFDGPQYYKIGDWVTFAWNYTSLSVSPTAIDILATCTANQGTYTIAINQTVEETGRVLWDTGATGTLPFLTETYTLVVYDADSSISARPKPGYLGTYQQFTFGMYEKQPYVPWTEFKCNGCNGALSSHEISTMKIFFISGSTMLASFFFFAHNFGLW
ncbi:hypothetical protein GQ43DRAFT_165005 [Delitschia confertaspora ATCC 74209]|uniref:DUF7137 domain-containing protein n=1 Tax=Delitschia confertaspora ATCC 74209 TaxID=1513339 RepID=A0A9P4JKH4_9PLEO|nr:hypothetical protein GQ43DRAFT_165005 [Delitschia confertaspora ATCC 74209]